MPFSASPNLNDEPVVAADLVLRTAYLTMTEKPRPVGGRVIQYQFRPVACTPFAYLPG